MRLVKTAGTEYKIEKENFPVFFVILPVTIALMVRSILAAIMSISL